MTPKEQLIETLKKNPKFRPYANYTIAAIAATIADDWPFAGKMYYGAKPYASAMHCLTSINDKYGEDSGKSIVAYFLCNATTWRGPIARAVKAELNLRLKGK